MKWLMGWWNQTTIKDWGDDSNRIIYRIRQGRIGIIQRGSRYRDR